MSVRAEDWEVLGLEPGADLIAARRAHHRRRALYESDALATYNLLDDDERAAMLVRIDEAYERIAGSAAAATGGGCAEATWPAEPPPDPRAEPGASLRHARLTIGLSLQQIAAETKIGVAILERIEAEDFAALPAAVFVRGHVLQFARELRIAEAEGLAKAYLAKMQAQEDVQR